MAQKNDAPTEKSQFVDAVYLRNSTLHKRLTEGRYRVEVDENGIALNRIAAHPRDGTVLVRLPAAVANRVRTMRTYLNSIGGKAFLDHPSEKATFDSALRRMVMSYPIPSRQGVASREGKTPEDAGFFHDVEFDDSQP